MSDKKRAMTLLTKICKNLDLLAKNENGSNPVLADPQDYEELCDNIDVLIFSSVLPETDGSQILINNVIQTGTQYDDLEGLETGSQNTEIATLFNTEIFTNSTTSITENSDGSANWIIVNPPEYAQINLINGEGQNILGSYTSQSVVIFLDTLSGGYIDTAGHPYTPVGTLGKCCCSNEEELAQLQSINSQLNFQNIQLQNIYTQLLGINSVKVVAIASTYLHNVASNDIVNGYKYTYSDGTSKLFLPDGTDVSTLRNDIGKGTVRTNSYILQAGDSFNAVRQQNLLDFTVTNLKNQSHFQYSVKPPGGTYEVTIYPVAIESQEFGSPDLIFQGDIIIEALGAEIMITLNSLKP